MARDSGLVRRLSDFIDDNKVHLDDMLDRASDMERDVRRTARRALEPCDDGDYDELANIEDAVADLRRELGRGSRRRRRGRYDRDGEGFGQGTLRDELSDVRRRLRRYTRGGSPVDRSDASSDVDGGSLHRQLASLSRQVAALAEEMQWLQEHNGSTARPRGKRSEDTSADG